MKKEVTKARNVFNCEAFHLEHITNMDEVRQLLKYEMADLQILVSSLKESDYNLVDDDLTPPLSKEELECGFRLYQEAEEVCKRNRQLLAAFIAFFIIALYREFNYFDCERFNLQHITTMDEVKQFAEYLKYLQIHVTLKKPFEKYLVRHIEYPLFTKEEAAIGNRLMKESIKVCKANHEDVYHIMGASRDNRGPLFCYYFAC